MEKKRISESPDDSTSRDGTAAVFEESQTRFGLSQQGVAQFTQAAGTSRGVNVIPPNPSDEPVIPSRIPNVCNTGEILLGSKMEAKEKKKEQDRAYRARKKLEREQLESDLRMAGKENEDLKRENERLRSEKDQGLRMVGKENEDLKRENERLRSEKDQGLRMAGKENEDLKRENERLRSEKDQGLRMAGKENEDLKRENERLRWEKDQGLRMAGKENEDLKRENERLRSEKDQGLRMVGKENEDLKRENERLRWEKDQGLQASAAERANIRHQQQVHLDAFSHKPLQDLQSRKIKDKIRQLREEIAEINREEHRCMKEGQTKLALRFEEKQSQCEKPREETEFHNLKRRRIEGKISPSREEMVDDLMLKIIEASSQNDSALVARLTSSLRDLLSKQNQ